MKGSVLDAMVIPIVAFVLIFAVIFTYVFLDSFNTAAQDALPQVAKDAVTAGMDQYLFWDQGIIVLIGGLFVVALIGAAMVNAHPIFFAGSIMLLITFIIVGALITNVFMDIAGNANISATANLFPLTIQFFQNLPIWLVVFTISIAIVMFSFGGRDVVN